MTQADFVNMLGKLLEAAGIPYMVVGSHASSYHGQYRSTNDVDIVIDPSSSPFSRQLSMTADKKAVGIRRR